MSEHWTSVNICHLSDTHGVSKASWFLFNSSTLVLLGRAHTNAEFPPGLAFNVRSCAQRWASGLSVIWQGQLSHRTDEERTVAGRLQSVGVALDGRATQEQIASLYVRGWADIVHSWWLLAHTVSRWVTALATRQRSVSTPAVMCPLDGPHLNAWEHLSKSAQRRLKETLLLFLFFISNWFGVRDIISTAWEENGSGKLLLSFKLQGASFIMKVQRNGKCEAAASQCLCLLLSIPHREQPR